MDGRDGGPGRGEQESEESGGRERGTAVWMESRERLRDAHSVHRAQGGNRAGTGHRDKCTV